MISIKNWLLPALLVVCCALLNACEDPDNIGIEVQPDDIQPGVFFTDTLTLEATVIREDTLRSDDGIALVNLMGSFSDPVFGRSSASIYSQFRLPNNNTNFSFGNDPLLDSVVLTLAYTDYYGDTLTPLTVEVHQLNEMLYLDSNYYTNDVALLGSQIGNSTVDIRPRDSVLVDGTKRAPHMRIRLDNAFGSSFITSGDANFLTNASFTSYFNGIYIKAQDINTPGQGSILTFNLQALLSKMTFYYKNGTDTTRHEAHFEINADCPRFTHFDHDYTTAQFGSTFPISGENKMYVQSMAGVKVRFKFPHLKNLVANGLVSINKAELEIPVEDNGLPILTMWPCWYLVWMMPVEKRLSLTCWNPHPIMAAHSDQISITYLINLARYVQRTVSGDITTDYGLSLISASAVPRMHNRSIIPGHWWYQ